MVAKLFLSVFAKEEMFFECGNNPDKNFGRPGIGNPAIPACTTPQRLFMGDWGCHRIVTPAGSFSGKFRPVCAEGLASRNIVPF